MERAARAQARAQSQAATAQQQAEAAGLARAEAEARLGAAAAAAAELREEVAREVTRRKQADAEAAQAKGEAASHAAAAAEAAAARVEAAREAAEAEKAAMARKLEAARADASGARQTSCASLEYASLEAAAERGAAAEGTGALEAQLAAQAARRQRAADEAAELRRQAEEADPTQMAELQSLVALNTKLKQQQGDFKKQCKTQLQQMQQERAKQEAHEQQDADATADEHLARVQEIERVYAAETAKADKMRRLLGQKGRSIASLQRQIDDIPTRAELMQYERRFRELYQQVASKSEETKKYYDSYNMLDEKKGYLVKEASLINSIHENFAKSAAGGGGRDKLVESVEGLVKSVQQSLDKVKARLADEVAQKEAAQLQYDKLVDKERKYFKLVKEFQLECERNEQVG